jgi:hypothetical protein
LTVSLDDFDLALLIAAHQQGVEARRYILDFSCLDLASTW